MAKGVTFIAALAEGENCLAFDRDGEAKLKLVVSQQEGVKVARALRVLQDVSFRVTLTPLKKGEDA